MVACMGTLAEPAGARGGVELSDAQNNVRYRAWLDADGNPTIELLDASRSVVWSAA